MATPFASTCTLPPAVSAPRRRSAIGRRRRAVAGFPHGLCGLPGFAPGAAFPTVRTDSRTRRKRWCSKGCCSCSRSWLCSSRVGAVFFSLDSLATARDDAAVTVAESSAQQAQDHGDHNTAIPLESFAGQVSEDAEQVAKAHAPYDAKLPPIPAGDVVKVRMVMKHKEVEIAPGVKYNGLGVRRRLLGPRADRARAPGPDGRVHARQRRPDPALDGLPRRADRAERRVQGRESGRVVHVPLQGERPRRLHVPLRHEARARAHRERHVRRDRRAAGARAAEGRPRVRARRERVVPERERPRRGRRASTWRRPARPSPTGRPSTGTRTSTSRTRSCPTPARPCASGSSRPGRRSTRTSTSSGRSSTAPG